MQTPNSTRRNLTPKEMEADLGERLRTLRIHRNMEQTTVAERACISVRTLRNLETGNGSSLRTLVDTPCASWISTNHRRSRDAEHIDGCCTC